MIRNVCLFVIVCLIILSAPMTWGYTEKMCIQCHRESGGESTLHIPLAEYLSSVHGKEIGCMDCHEEVKSDAHFALVKTRPVDCQKCHEEKRFHARDQSISCKDCHPPHEIYPARDPRSSVNWKNLGGTCGKCHPGQSKKVNIFERLIFWKIATHPKQNFAKKVDRRMCVGCHQGQAAHGETTLINDQDCFKCHRALAGNSSELGYFHVMPVWNNLTTKSFISWINLIGFVGIAIMVLTFFGNKRKR